MFTKITLRADKGWIEQARRIAAAKNTTLNAEFRRWLEQYVEDAEKGAEFSTLMESVSYAKAGKAFTRDELNERK